MNSMTESANFNPIVNLEGKVGIITGLANDKSIAYGIAKACRRAGAQLAACYQTEKTATYVKPLVDALGVEVFELCDVAIPGSLEAFYSAVEQRFGKVDFIVHAMAFAPKDDLHGRVVDCSMDGFQKAMNISTHSFIRMAKLAEPLMKDGGTMLTMTYLGADRVVDNYGLMGLCKAALESASRYLAHELGPKGIRVLAVSPGPMLTRAASGIAHFDDLMDQAIARAPLHRLATPDQVGSTCAFLVSDAAAGMTGSTIYVDAGYHIEA